MLRDSTVCRHRESGNVIPITPRLNFCKISFGNHPQRTDARWFRNRDEDEDSYNEESALTTIMLLIIITVRHGMTCVMARGGTDQCDPARGR